LTKNIFGRRKWHLETLDNENSDDDDDRDDDGRNSSARRKRGKRKKEDGDLQLLFPEAQRKRPPDTSKDEKDTSTNNDDGENETQMRPRKEQVHTTTESVRSVPCILNLEKSGKFSLSIAEDDKHNQNDPSDTASLTASHPSPSIHQPLQGEWFLTPNPYCITDRHYDTLLLVSDPRMRRRSTIIEKATVELRCKIWGRYGVGAVRKKIGVKHGRVRGRMTHGTIVIVKEQVDGVGEKKMLPTREVVGTFHGKTIVDFDSLGNNVRLNEEEELPDGLDDDDDEDDFYFEDNFDEFGVLRPIDE